MKKKLTRLSIFALALALAALAAIGVICLFAAHGAQTSSVGYVASANSALTSELAATANATVGAASLPAATGASALLAIELPKYVEIGVIVFIVLAVVIAIINLCVAFHGSKKAKNDKKTQQSEKATVIITYVDPSDDAEEVASEEVEEVPEAVAEEVAEEAQEEAEVVEEEASEDIEEAPAEAEEVVEETAAAEEVEEVVAEEPVEEEVVAEAAPAEEASNEEETVEEVEASDESQFIAALADGEVEESESGAVVHTADGTYLYLQYNKSFTAKLIQAKDDVRDYYNIIKNHALSYKKVTTRISWHHENVNRGRDKVARLVLRGKSLYLYLPLNPEDFAETKYKVEAAGAKRFEDLPCLYRIKNPRRAKYACELIDIVMENYGLERTEKAEEDFVAEYPYEETLPLIRRGLIKVTQSNRNFGGNDNTEETVEETTATVEKPVEEIVEEEAVVTDAAEEVVEEPVEEAVEETVEEEPAEEAVEEPVEEPAEEPVFIAEPLTEVRVQEAQQLMTDEQANAMVIQGARQANKTKKGIINIDVLSRFFNNGDTVNVEEIKKRVKNFDKKVTYVKVLARGTLNKRLIVEADEFSVDAEKMILLMGGTVIKTLN